ncbi:MAG: tRNA (adenosine(37)-N6)-dimethylallyltransferase [Thermoplasmatota archaeon]
MIITGPTASGKTRMAESMARRFDCEIVSADSRTRYGNLRIGTGRNDLSKDVQYHIVDDLRPGEFSSSHDWCQKARSAVSSIREKGAHPLICGGSVHLIHAFMGGLVGTPPPDPELRTALKLAAAKLGSDHLHGLLMALDPDAGSRVHPHNSSRIIRYIEKAIGTEKAERVPPYEGPYKLVSTHREREELNRLIRSRVRKMIDDGWVEEVRMLLEDGHPPGSPMFTSTGYGHIIDHIKGVKGIEETERSIISDTIALSRKQIRWARKHGAEIFDLSGTDEEDAYVDELSTLLQQEE